MYIFNSIDCCALIHFWSYQSKNSVVKSVRVDKLLFFHLDALWTHHHVTMAASNKLPSKSDQASQNIRLDFQHGTLPLTVCFHLLNDKREWQQLREGCVLVLVFSRGAGRASRYSVGPSLGCSFILIMHFIVSVDLMI